MKALKSSLAKAVLADPTAKGQLRAYLAAKSTATLATRPGTPSSATSTAPAPARVIEVFSHGKLLRVTPTVVPKAA